MTFGENACCVENTCEVCRMCVVWVDSHPNHTRSPSHHHCAYETGDFLNMMLRLYSAHTQPHAGVDKLKQHCPISALSWIQTLCMHATSLLQHILALQ